MTFVVAVLAGVIGALFLGETTRLGLGRALNAPCGALGGVIGAETPFIWSGMDAQPLRMIGAVLGGMIVLWAVGLLRDALVK